MKKADAIRNLMLAQATGLSEIHALQEAHEPVPADMLDALEAIQVSMIALAQTMWIPTSRRLPNEEFQAFVEKFPGADAEEDFEVIVVIDDAQVSTALYYRPDRGFYDEYNNSYHVSAWMPLPTPPNEKMESDSISCKE